jgi:hypothetical protein
MGEAGQRHAMTYFLDIVAEMEDLYESLSDGALEWQ